MQDTGKRLRKCRIERGLTRMEAAEMLHVTPGYLGRIETGISLSHTE